MTHILKFWPKKVITHNLSTGTWYYISKNKEMSMRPLLEGMWVICQCQFSMCQQTNLRFLLKDRWTVDSVQCTLFHISTFFVTSLLYRFIYKKNVIFRIYLRRFNRGMDFTTYVQPWHREAGKENGVSKLRVNSDGKWLTLWCPASWIWNHDAWISISNSNHCFKKSSFL